MKESEVIAAFESRGQGHVFRFREELSEDERGKLCREAEAIDLDELDRLVRGLVGGDGQSEDYQGIEPAPFVALPENGGDPGRWAQARACGEEVLRAGRVAAFTVAGGQGTRLGFDGPKGTYPVTPVRGHSLFRVFAEKILAASRRYGVVIPWFLMTSEINHEATRAAFEEADYFGLPPDSVMLFRQGLMPAVDRAGRILLADKGQIALSPDGHGGALRALVRSGAVARMEELGIDVLSYFQVDNPLVRCIDPTFIGFHVLAESELSSKALPKAYAEEKVGIFCRQDGRNIVVEYSDMPAELMQAADERGELVFRAGSIAIHIFDRDFVKRMGGGETGPGSAAAGLPFHRADKKVPIIDESGAPVVPDTPNAIKFEMFVFDALPFADNPVIIETARQDDFSPVKNAQGVDSARTCRDDQLRQFARWFAAAGIAIECDTSGLPGISIEVSPLFADSQESFVAAWNALEQKPALEDGLVLSGSV
jgi:UDP-N-acetylglucosamine/UDP-N-acetylgalactosamine diphosphorylase